MKNLLTFLIMVLSLSSCYRNDEVDFKEKGMVTADTIILSDSALFLHSTIIDIGPGITGYGHLWCPAEVRPGNFSNLHWVYISEDTLLSCGAKRTDWGSRFSTGPFVSEISLDQLSGNSGIDFYSYLKLHGSQELILARHSEIISPNNPEAIQARITNCSIIDESTVKMKIEISPLEGAMGKSFGRGVIMVHLTPTSSSNPEEVYFGEIKSDHEVEIGQLEKNTMYEATVDLHLDNRQTIPGDAFEFKISGNWVKLETTQNVSPRWGTAHFVADEKVYFGCGWEGPNGTNASRELWTLDLPTRTWDRKWNYPGSGLAFGVGFTNGVTGFIARGVDQNYSQLSALWAYNLNTGLWVQQGSVPGDQALGGVAFVIGEKAYLTTGNYSNEVWEYDMSVNRWQRKSDFPGIPRRHAVAAVIDGVGYMGFGENLHTFGQLNDWWRYDPKTDDWRSVASLETTDASGARSGAFIFGTGSHIYVGGGWSSTYGYINNFYQYDPVNNRWTRKADLPTARSKWSSGYAVNGIGYVSLGETTNAQATETWMYIPN